MVTTSTMHIRPDFPRNRLLQGLAAWYALVWIATAIAPLDRHDWFLENVLAVALVALLLATYRVFPLSDLSYVLIAAFLTLHAIGAHYTYALVPLGEWMKQTFGFSRNPFDRLVHFSFGLLMAYPIREVFLRVANARGFWAYYLPLDVTLAFSALYEIMEMVVAQVVAPNTGDAWLGTQGDVWDAQKDMGSAFCGAILCMTITALVRSLRQKPPVLLAGGTATAALVVGALSLAPTVGLSAQSAPLGFAARSAPQERGFEQGLLAVPDTASARLMTQDLSRVPHMAGTPAQAVTRDYVLDKLRSWGLEAWSKEYTVYLPQPDTVAAWIIATPGAPPRPLSLAEPRVAGDPATAGPQVPPFNGYTGDGEVTAELVYVNYGLIEDYKTLDSLSVSVRGKIAIARYGRSFRGIKAREAEQHGALGLIVYSDPQDDGYFRGDVYPTGPMRPAGGIQRGSMLDVNGDPTTPGYPSIAGAHRVPEESLPLPRIPIMPMGYGNAQRFLELLGGPSVPQSWQGGLPFRYHVGAGPVRARLKVQTERGARALHPIWDTFGILRGERAPDEWVVVGAHRDAWSPGAEDNISGTVTVLEAARAFAELAHQGGRPARTILFATWDAEEWGLIGSTEWVEEMEDSLRAHVVAYINEDVAASGTSFGGGSSPSLKALIRQVAQVVPAPAAGSGTVYDAWLKQNKGDTSALKLGNLGGGSDFAGFSHHLGIPSGGIGFSGAGGVYHSMYDSYHWMTTFGDSGYRAHRAAAQLVSVTLARLANAEVVPLDYVGFGTEMSGLVAQLDSGIAAHAWVVGTQGLKDALARFTETARRFAQVRDSALAQATDAGRYARANAALMQVERRLTRPEGLASRPWYRSLQFASDLDDGYATVAFPSVNEAIRYADAAATERELRDLVARVDQARDALEQATAALR